ncbi:hypothetical protein [Vulcanisaeta distributa]|uniref:hypothetical protein n=1 Tax=Vulcanisaeta distributa TaxID=164451 RepID=UPI000A91E2A0|nr:hypothetical protein [Vulcanisaeta distributa]
MVGGGDSRWLGSPQSWRGPGCNGYGAKYLGRALPLLRRFIAEELPRLKLNVRDSNGLYKFTTATLRRYLARHLGEDKAYGALIAIVTGHLMAELARNGYEIVYRRKGTYIVRRVGGDGKQ